VRPTHGKASLLRKSLLGFVVVTVVLAAWGCSDYHPSSSGSSTPTLSSIMVTAPLTSVAPGSTDQFTATGHYSDGSTQNLTSTATWNSSNTSAATISNTAGTQGLATGVAIGSTNITASLNGVTSSPVFSLTVTGAALASIAVTPLFSRAVAGITDQFNATGHYSDGSTQNLTSAATWNSSNTAALTISNTTGSQGLATHVAIGSTRITASMNGVTSSPAFSLTVTVAVLKAIAVTAPLSRIAAVSTDQFTAIGHYSDGSTQDLTSTATWNSSNTAAATISNTAGTQGLATSVAIGSTNIMASMTGVTSSPVFTLRVTAAVLTSITVTAPLTSVAPGRADQFTATGHYSDGSMQSLTTVATWNSTNTSAATISNTAGMQGLATAVAIGSTSITASLNGVTSSPVFSLTVAAATLTSITVTAPLTSVTVGGTDQFTAAGHYSDGSTQDLTSTATWNSSNTSAATISNTAGTQGLATGVTIGSSTNITASLNGVTSSPAFNLMVALRVLSAITVTSPSSSVQVGRTDQFTATGHYSDSSTQDLTNVVTWNLSNTVAIFNNVAATISNAAGTQGLATGVNTGSTKITAALNGVSSNAEKLTVTGGFVPTGSLNVSRQNHTATLLNNGMVLITGGWDQTTLNVFASAELYDPATGTFTPTGSMTTARFGHTATLLNNGMVLIAGGTPPRTAVPPVGQSTASAELYDPSTGTFSPTGSMQFQRSNATATMLDNGKVLIAGGDSNTSLIGFVVASAELYDPAIGTFTPTGFMTSARAGHSATLLNNGKVLVAGGYLNCYQCFSSSAELYNPATGTFMPTGSMITPQTAQRAALLNNGMVLIAGGDFYSVGVPAPELYDPSTGTFTLTAAVSSASENYGVIAMLLNDGMVLIAGNTDPAFTCGCAGLYDPTTQSFSSTGNVATFRAGETQTLLNNGMVLVAGGYPTTDFAALSSAELYEPDTLTLAGLVSIAVSPLDPTIPAGSYQRFVATGTFSDSSTEQLASVIWGSSNSAVATITNDASNHGAAYAAAAGSATLSACDGPVCGSATLTVGVNGGMLTSITVTAPSSTVAAGSTDQFTATGHYSDGSTQDLTSKATWNSSNMAVATISNTAGSQGLATSVAIGSTNITASMSGVISSPVFSLTVTAAVLTSITVTAPLTSITPGSTDQFTATGHYSDGSTQDLTSKATWNSSNPAVAAIGNTAGSLGLATAVAIGNTIVTASLNGVTSGADTLAVALGLSFGLVPTGNLITARLNHTATLLNNGMVLIASGDNIQTTLASAELYDPTTGIFIPTGRMSIARNQHTATLLNNGKVLIAGGENPNIGYLASAELYDPATGTFTPTGSMGAARAEHTATLLNNGMVLIAGGFNGNGNVLTSEELYDPATGTFTPTGTLNTPRSAHSAVLLRDGMVLIAGGYSGGYLSSAELYDPATGIFTPTGSMTTERASQTATRLNNGMVLIVGGSNFGADLATAELYDPTTGIFTFTGAMTFAHSNPRATLLNNGMVLITAGESGTFTVGGSTANLELYDPVAGTFTPSGGLTGTRIYHSATLLSNGKVLIAGGFGQDYISGALPFAFAYLFEPATLTPTGLASIAVSPLSPTISPGTSRRLIATGTFSDNSTEQLASVTWSSSNNAVATITSDATNEGAAFGEALGTSTINACTGLVCGSTTVTVSSTGGVGPAASIAATAGGGQSATVLTAFATPLQVLVEDASDNLVPNATVTFTAPASGASGTFANGTATTTAVTNSSGVATASAFTANSVSGAYSVTASVSGVSATANFTLTNVPSLQASIIATGGGSQAAAVSTPFATALQVTVMDTSGNLLPNLTVTFTAPASGASGMFANGTATTTAVTNSSGVATASAFTANGAAGSYSVTASVPGVITTASFSLTNTASALAIVATGGGGQAATVSTAFATALQATVKDGLGNLVPNVTVTFTAPASSPSGAFANGTATTTAVTNSSGVATASAFVANRFAGVYSVTASVPGVSATASFSLTNSPGAPASIVATGGGGQGAPVSTPFATTLQAAVQDATGHLIPNLTVTFTAPASGASGTFANGTASTTAVTDSNGMASASVFTANSTAGGYKITASVSGVGATASFSMTNTPSGAAALVVSETYESQVTSGGAIVLLDGIFAGRISSSGSLTTQVTPGSHTVTILDVGGRGDVSVNAVAGTSTPAMVNVTETDAVYAPASSSIPQIVGGAFAYADATKNPITIQFLDALSNPVIVTALSHVYLDDNAGDVVNLSPYTTVTLNGTLSVNLVSALQTLGPDAPTIAAKGPFSIDYAVQDTNGVPYTDTQQFGLGIYSITGTIQAPPSNHALPVGNVQLSFQSDSGVVLQATCGAGGAFTIAGVPPDSYNVQGSFTSGGINYSVQGTAVVQGNVIVSVVPLGPIDISNNVVSVTTTPAQGAAVAPAISNRVAAATATPIPAFRLAPALRSASRPGQGRSAAAANSSSGSSPTVPSTTTVPKTSVYGPSITNPSTNTDFCTGFCIPSSGFGESSVGITYSIPRGTPAVNVVYQVCTQENLAGPFDEAGVAVVDGNGTLLYYDVESIYAQSTSPFTFVILPNGCTAVFQGIIDVSSLTTSSPAPITVYVLAVDSITNLVTTIPTFTTAILTPSLTIKSFTLDPFTVLDSCGGKTVSSDTKNIQICKTASNGSYISIPSDGANNCFQYTSGNCFMRPATAVLNFSPDPNTPLMVTNVKLDLNWVDQNGINLVDTIFDEAPGDRVVLSKDKTKLMVSSIGYLASSGPNLGLPSFLLNSSHPDLVSYMLTVTGTQGGVPVTATKNLSLSATNPIELFPTLWSAVNAGVTIPRFGPMISGPVTNMTNIGRDLGGDDWATQNTINWLKAIQNSSPPTTSIIVSYNDISGEHGRNLGHKTHGDGEKLDIFQFLTINNASSGGQNYQNIASTANSAALQLFRFNLIGSGYDRSFMDTVVNFIIQNRAGINALSDNGNVKNIIFAYGNTEFLHLPRGNQLASGWLKNLMCYGRLDLGDGTSVNLGGPNGLGYFGNGDATWTPGPNKPVYFQEDHDDHLHINLTFPPIPTPSTPPTSCAP
jgi:Fe-S cluster assembly iron-binding protein IscA